MKTRWIIVALTACMAVSLYLRIVLPYDNVFTGQWIKFTSNDAYWQMANIDRIAPDFPAYITQIFNIPFFQWLLSGVIWCIGLGNPTQTTIDTIAVYFPPILAALTVIPVYFIGKTLFNRFVGIVAVALIAVLPGEWLGRSLLGFTDHHVAEVLFSTTALMFLLFALKSSGKRQIAYACLAALFTAICVFAWPSTMLILGVISMYAVVLIALRRLHLVVLGVMLATFAVYFLLINPDLVPRMWTYLTSSTTITTTLEMRPLFFPAGAFTHLAAWGNFTTLFLVVPVAMIILLIRSIKERDSNIILLFIWSVVMLAAMLCFRRFAYYFAINAALLGGFMAWYLWHFLKGLSVTLASMHHRFFSYFMLAFAIIITSVLLYIMIIPNYQIASATAKNVSFAPSDDWMGALEWTRNNTGEDSLILAWWDYGYWIMREADRTAYANPMQDKIPCTNTARMFLSASDNNSVDADYIIIDYNTVMGKFWAVATWAEENPSNFNEVYYIAKDGNLTPVHLFYPEYYQSLAVRLYNFDGRAVTPTQSTVIGITFGGKILNSIDVFGSYEEAVTNCGIGEKLVGTSAFVSPIPLEKVDGYSLVYESVEKVNGFSEVKIFKRG